MTTIVSCSSSMNQVLTVHVTCTDVELRTTGLCMLTTTSPNSFCTRRWSTPCAVGLMSGREREWNGMQVGREGCVSESFLCHLFSYLECGQAQTWGWGPRALEHWLPWWWTGRPYWAVGPLLRTRWSSRDLPLSASCYSPTDCRRKRDSVWRIRKNTFITKEGCWAVYFGPHWWAESINHMSV